MNKLLGRFQQFTHPNNAERLSASKYWCHYHEESNIVEGEMNYIGDKIICPKCNRLSDEVQEHGDAWQCPCGLCWQTFGNSIYIWKDYSKVDELLSNILK